MTLLSYTTRDSWNSKAKISQTKEKIHDPEKMEENKKVDEKTYVHDEPVTIFILELHSTLANLAELFVNSSTVWLVCGVQ